jgi:hypothetical protein
MFWERARITVKAMLMVDCLDKRAYSTIEFILEALRGHSDLVGRMIEHKLCFLFLE